MTLSYPQWKNLVSLISVMSVPLGVFTGWMMALGDWWAAVGAAGLMVFDWYGSRAWLRAIEKAVETSV